MKQLILFLLLGTCNTLFAQHTKLIQEAMNNYDYEKAIMLIDKEQPTTELLFQKGKHSNHWVAMQKHSIPFGRS